MQLRKIVVMVLLNQSVAEKDDMESLTIEGLEKIPYSVKY